MVKHKNTDPTLLRHRCIGRYLNTTLLLRSAMGKLLKNKSVLLIELAIGPMNVQHAFSDKEN